MYRSSTLLGLATVMGLIGCGDGESARQMKVLRAEREVDATAELARKRSMQAITIVAEDGTVEERDSISDPANYTCRKLRAELESRSSELGDRLSSCASSDWWRDIWKDACWIDMFLRIAEGQPVDIIDGSSNIKYRVGPQNSAVRSRYAKAVGRWDDDTLSAIAKFGVSVDGCSDVGYLASLLSDTFRKTLRGRELDTELVLAVADAERGTTPVRDLAAYRAMNSLELSRFNATRSFVGGYAHEEEGEYFRFPGGGNGFCSSKRLNAQAQVALKILRESAISPAAILATPELSPGSGSNAISTDALLDSSLSLGSVKARLEAKWNSTIAAPVGFAKFFGLTVDDFHEARLFLGQEIQAFSRSMEPRAETFGSYQRYPSVETPVTERDRAYYVAVAQGAPRYTQKDTSPDPTANDLDVYGWGYALEPATGTPSDLRSWACVKSGETDLSDAYKSLKLVHLGRWEPYPENVVHQFTTSALECLLEDYAVDDATRNVAAPFVALAQDLKRDYEGTVQHCNDHVKNGSSEEFVGTRVNFLTPMSGGGYGYRVVIGEDALHCYTTGAVEGVPCDALEQTRRADWIRTDLLEELDGNYRSPTLNLGDSYASAMASERWYVLKTREPITDLNTNAPPIFYGHIGPGLWESVTGFVPRAPFPELADGTHPEGNSSSCRRVPVYRSIEDKIVEVLKPSSLWCGEQATSCVGLGPNDPLPLEDELTSDGTEYENSWKHYLSLAKDAAAHADLLAQQYIDYGISTAEFQLGQEEKKMAREEKAIASLERVQQLCGTSVDPTRLLSALDGALGDFNLEDLYQDVAGITCTASSVKLPGSIYDCVGGHRVLSWRKIVATAPDLKPLADCLVGDGDLSADATEAFVHLGDAPLCIPQAAIVGSCGTSVSPCPATVVATTEDDGDVTCPASESYAPPVPAQAGLGFFSTRDVLGSEERGGICSDVREALRSQDSEAIVRLKNSRGFALPKLRELAGDMRIDKRIGTYAAVKLGSAYWETGSTQNGPNTTRWPCTTADMPPDCTIGDKSLFCTSWDCSTAEGRANANRHLVRSALLAKVSVWNADLGDLTYPIPVQLYGKPRPYNNTSSSVEGVWMSGSAPFYVNTYGGNSWQIFEANPVGLPAAERYAWIEYSDDPFGSTQESRKHWEYDLGLSGRVTSFGFRTTKLSFPHQSDNFWGGFAGNGTTDGCVLKALRKDPDAFKSCDIGDHTMWEGGDWRKYDFVAAQFSYGLAGLTLPQDWQSVVEADLPISYHIGEVQSDTFNYWDDQLYIKHALEMYCMAQQDSVEGYGCDNGAPTLARVEQLDEMGEYLECSGQRIINKGATTVFRNMPKAVLDPFRASGSGVYQAASGEVGSALSDLRTALMDAYTIQSTVGHTVKQFGSEMKALQAAFKGFGADERALSIEFQAKSVAELAACASAASNVVGIDTAAKWGRVGVAVATCANSVAQIRFADMLRDVKGESLDAAKEQAIARFNESFDTKAQILDEQATELSRALERINAAIGRIANMRSEAERVFADALWHMTRQAKSTAAVGSALSNRKALAKERYQRAEQNARRMAYLAKRAIEQRLGIHMDEMTDALPLVEAPASWESKICTSAGIDYEAFTKTMTEENVVNVADGFIGDYVRKLENVIESYRLVEGFQDGSDIAIVSLKEDVLASRDICQVTASNLLKQSDHPEGFDLGWSSETASWHSDGCAMHTDIEGKTVADANCVSVDWTGESVMPTGAEQSSSAYAIRFGIGAAGPNPCSGATGECGWTSNTALGQRLTLNGGSFALSWYEKTGANDPEAVQALVKPLGTQTVSTNLTDQLGLSTAGWRKRWIIVTLSERGDVFVGFRAGMKSNGTYTSTGTIAAPMFEALSDNQAAAGTNAVVGVYESTDELGNARVRACLDPDGNEFRRSWTRGCMNVCPDGYSSDCREFAKKACYHEIAFPITQRDIESGKQFQSSGFASGNFNYRINKIGLSVVGTGVRKCDSLSGAACYGSGFATYTLEHQGPYLVRNHKGADFRAALKEGRIEHARALAAERYVTNPMSSSDKTLLQDYMRREMAGRPLNGSFVLRIWDEEGLDFGAIEDVQLVVDYGYWTRLQ